LRKEAEETEEALRKVGFDCTDDDGELSIAWKLPKELKQAVDTAVKAAIR